MRHGYCNILVNKCMQAVLLDVVDIIVRNSDRMIERLAIEIIYCLSINGHKYKIF